MMFRKVFILFAIVLMIISIMPPQTFSQSSSSKKWTLMIYLDADNNLEEAGIDDFNEMEVVGSTAEVNVVVQFDRTPGYDTSNGDWEDAKRYYVTKDDDSATITSTELADLGEVNTGAPETLIDFVLWAVRSYPAEHYLLDFWDHGGGWQGVCWDDTNGNDSLTFPEVEYALSAVRNITDKNIDIALFDACNVGGIEALYQIRNYADVAVASEATVPGDGCPYDKILEFITSTSGATEEELAAKIVELYIASYSDGAGDPQDTPSATMSAFKLKGFDKLSERLDELSMMLAKKSGGVLQGGYNGEIVWSRNNAQQFMTIFVPLLFPNILSSTIDLYGFVDALTDQPTIDANTKEKAREVLEFFDELKIAEDHCSGYKNAHGLTIYFPNGASTSYSQSYEQIAFAADKYWNEFIHYADNRQNAQDPPPTCLITEPEPWASISSEYCQIKGTAFDVESLQIVQIRIDNGEWQTVEGFEEWSYNWQPSSGKHKIYARSFDGTQYSTEFEVEVEVPAKSSGVAPVTFWVIIGIAVALVGFVLLLAIKKIRKKGLSSKLLAH